MVAVERAKRIRHTQYGASAQLERRLVDHAERAYEPFIRHGRLFDLQRIEFAITLHDDIYFPGIPIAV